MDYEYDDNEFPLAYLITIRCYGTWLHGDEKGSVDRHGFNVYDTPRRIVNLRLQKAMRREMKQKPVLFSTKGREVVEQAIAEVCRHRGYQLHAVNVRSNHLHAVVSARIRPELITNAFKSYSTRRLRENSIIDVGTKPWARGQSRKYLWKPPHVALAVEYVLHGQENTLPDFND